MRREPLKKLTMAAVCAAAVTILTGILRLPTPMGYVHLGDAGVLLTALLLPVPYAAAAAAAASCLADLLAGFAVYIPATAVIKACMVLVMSAVCRRSQNRVHMILGSVAAEGLMAAGYAVYEAFFLGYGAGALPGLWVNAVQGAAGVIIAAVIGKHILSAGGGQTRI